MESPSRLTSHVELLGGWNQSMKTREYWIVFTSLTYKTNNIIKLQCNILYYDAYQYNLCYWLTVFEPNYILSDFFYIYWMALFSTQPIRDLVSTHLHIFFPLNPPRHSVIFACRTIHLSFPWGIPHPHTN